MKIIKMIVGLSNPIEKYSGTRHNMGSLYIKLLVQQSLNSLVEERKFLGFTSSIHIHGYHIRLLVPNVFMNINGHSVYKMAAYYNITLEEILIVHDDLDLKPGITKLKYSYGHSGHNGLRHVISTFGKKINFYRFRIGIGRPKNKNEISSFVLSKPTRIEENLIHQSILYAIDETFLLIKKRNSII